MYLRINGEGFDDGKGKGPSRLIQAGKALKTLTVLKAGGRVIEQELIDFGRNRTDITRHVVSASSSILCPRIRREQLANGSLG
jgi:hypothetical protein